VKPEWFAVMMYAIGIVHGMIFLNLFHTMRRK
jgi:hypothetical protein